MKRKDFIRNALSASVGSFALGYNSPNAERTPSNKLVAAIAQANDHRVKELVSHYRQTGARSNHRARSEFILALASAYCSEDSEYHQEAELIAPMQQVAETLTQHQYPDGTFDIGNLQSPPDTAFMMEQLWRAQALLQKNGSSETRDLRNALEKLLLNAADGLTTGGVHTPNHRWVISAALAGIHSLYPHQKYVDRINTWLAEGIGQDADGQHPERSPNYDAAVNNPCLLDIALLMDRPELLDHIRKNLEMTIYLTEMNGELETVASRRQDQNPGYTVMIHQYYLPYRYMAIRDNNPRFAQMAKWIESRFMDFLGEYLPGFQLHPELNKALPSPTSLSNSFVKHLQYSDLVRIRESNTAATIFGGSDWHLGHGVWSGLSHNPTFFKLRKGEAILESIRMAPAFFKTGYFRSDGVQKSGNSWQLHEERKVPYHQPLPGKFRKDDGDYNMSPDGRFFSKMNFPDRPKDYKTLRSEVAISHDKSSGSFEIDMTAEGTPNVEVTIELCFRKGGQLQGVIPKENDPDGYFLSQGTGSYKVGEDVIKFGPGVMEHSRPPQANEQYEVHNGDIQVEGHRVYITGRTPFNHKLTVS